MGDGKSVLLSLLDLFEGGLRLIVLYLAGWILAISVFVR